MSYQRLLMTITIMALLLVAGMAIADVPKTINYQGYLTDSAGPVTAPSLWIDFMIFDAETGGNLKWSESQQMVEVTDGFFNVVLGDAIVPSPIHDSVFSGADRWLEIVVSGETITPRTKLTSNSYAFRVSTVDGSTGGIISGDVSIQSDLMVSGKATIGPGNTNSGMYAFVAGENNVASGDYSTVGGGHTVTAGGDYSTIGGGRANSAQGDYSVILGGGFNTMTAAASFSMAFGDAVYIDNALRVIFFDGSTSGRFGLNRDHFDGGINHPIHVGTDGSNGNGAHLTSGGVWTNGSSREFKENFSAIDNTELLLKIGAMSVESWNFKNSDERHIGPVAEDFVVAFDVGTINEKDGIRENQYLASGDVAGVALAGVKALLAKIERLEARIAELEGR